MHIRAKLVQSSVVVLFCMGCSAQPMPPKTPEQQEAASEAKLADIDAYSENEGVEFSGAKAEREEAKAEKAEEAAEHPKAKTTDSEAKATALRTVPGTVTKVEHQKSCLEVIVRNKEGQLKGVEIDESTGQVLAVEDEQDDD